MESKLLRLVKREQRKQIFYAIGAALLLAIMILALSGGISWLDDSFDSSKVEKNNPNPSVDGYVVRLNNYIDLQFSSDGITNFIIAGNITSSIHPDLISSTVTPIENESLWEVETIVLNPDTPDPWDSKNEYFNFTSAQMGQIHTSFLSSLSQTEEVEKASLPEEPGSVPNLLYYSVLFDDGSGLEFIWLGFEEVDVIQIANITWSIGEYGINTAYEEEEHFISPLSAFDSFISTLQELYALNLD